MNRKKKIKLWVQNAHRCLEPPVGEHQSSFLPATMKETQTLTYSDCTAQAEIPQAISAPQMNKMLNNSCSVYKVCYEKSSKTKRISHVEAQVYKDGRTRSKQEYTKDDIIRMVNDLNFTVETRIKVHGDVYKDGAPVIVVTLNGTDFIKTEKNEITEDNLGELPIYERK